MIRRHMELPRTDDAKIDAVPQGGSRSARSLIAFLIGLVALAALWPSLGTFGAGLISDDGPALAYVHAHGPWADWLRPEYDVNFARFWRPMVTVSLGLQEAWTGVSAGPLRALNWCGHLASALLIVALARQLGARWLGAAAIGILVAWFPHQGGTVTWIVGRVDSQCVPFALGALVAILGGRTGLAGVLLFVALATKEVAIAVLPAAVLLCAVQRALRPDAELPVRRRTAWVVFGVTVATLILRRLAIGTWVGGYPGGLSASFPEGLGLAEVAHLVAATVKPLAPLWIATGVLCAVALAAQRGATRRATLLALAGVTLASLAAMAPLVSQLATGGLTEFHARTTLFADALFCLVLVVAFVPQAHAALSSVGVVLVLVLGAQRAQAARADTHEWMRAGDLAERLVESVSAAVDRNVPTPTEQPVLSTAFPYVLDGAYVFQWGVADRFRAPFPATRAPVWPWRVLFAGVHDERNSVTRVHDNLRWPFDLSLRTVATLPVTVVASAADPTPLEVVPVTAALLNEPGPLFVCEGQFPGARFEVLLFTDLGYFVGVFGGPMQAAAIGTVPDGQPELPPFGGVLALRDLMQLEPRGPGSGGPYLYEALRLAADFGSTEAYVELRVVDDARGERHRPVAASRWIHLRWDASLRDVLAPK